VSQDFCDSLVSCNDVAETNWTEGLIEIFFIAMIIVAAIDLNFSVVEKYDMANRPLVPEDVVAN
jgi:hypothetical protein